MRLKFILAVLTVISSCATSDRSSPIVTTEDLLQEMTDLGRLTVFSGDAYRTLQYSSYDRRSKSPSDSGWFANEDGFGGEPVPGFEKVLKEPDSSGIGEYLICDIKEPGVIQRLWSADITGKIRLFLDDPSEPFYVGDARPLFHNTLNALTSGKIETDYTGSVRQFDASYFPIPFSKSCRIEWIGNIKELHFYHVGFRIYKEGTKIESFNDADMMQIKSRMDETADILADPDLKTPLTAGEEISNISSIDGGGNSIIFDLKGERAIDNFSVKVNSSDPENVLRKCILTIIFDNSSIPQVQVPLGDFFGAAPGINPYVSLPFSVRNDGTMICRFVMPFRSNARILIENNSDEPIRINSSVHIRENQWIDSKTMHFRCRWKNEHNLTASNINSPENDVSDIVYLMAMGKGRIAGISANIYNPSNAPVSWGNWWGEGDEKIFIDNDTFPSFYGTGSEDYFNYSWSSARILNYPYCGQPRNDGPGNRGYVSNYRWHVADDIPFNNNIAFYMELGHHGEVPGFSYGRTVYYYALPGTIDNFNAIAKDEIRDITYGKWSPIAYLGSAGFNFIQAEKLSVQGNGIETVNDELCAEGQMVTWMPSRPGEEITFRFSIQEPQANRNLGLTLMHFPEGGKISVQVNGVNVKISGSEILDLGTSGYKVLDNHFTEKINLKAGVNKITLKSENGPGKKTGIDFIWIRN